MDLAAAYVQIIPSAEGITDSITQVLDPEAEKAGASAGEKISGGLGSKLKSIATTGLAAFGVISGAATTATGALAAGVGSIAEYGDNIDKMSQKMGMSAESYQEWDAVMQHSGTSMETMKASMKTLANAAETGSEAFELLGISQEEIANMSQEELFEATITALQNVDDETQRTYLAGKTLGRGATELGALLNTSAEDTQAMRDRVHELGGVMSDEAVKSAAAYQDSLQDMTTAFSGLSRGMMSEFMPSITQVMNGLTEIFSGNSEQGIGMVTTGIQSMMTSIGEMLPQIAEVATSIVTAIAQTFIANLPQIVEAGISIIGTLAGAFLENLPVIGEALLGVGEVIINTLTEYGPTILEKGFELISSLAMGIIENAPQATESLSEVVSQGLALLEENLPGFLDKGFEFIAQMATGILDNMPETIANLGEVVVNMISFLMDNMPEFLAKGVELLQNVGAGIIQNGPEILTTIAGVLGDIIGTIVEHLPDFLAKGVELLGQLAAGIVQAIPDLLAQLPQIFNDVLTELTGYDWASIGANLINGIIDGVTGFADDLAGAAIDAVSGAWNSMVDWLGIASPSKKARDIIGKNWALGIGVGFEGNMPIENMVGAVSDAMDDLSGETFDVTPTVDFGSLTYTAKTPEMARNDAGDTDRILAAMGDVVDALQALAQINVTLDDGTLVGRIDRQLGALASRRARY